MWLAASVSLGVITDTLFSPYYRDMPPLLPVAFTAFADGPMRPVYEEAGRQFVIDNRGKRVYGVWLVPFELFEESADAPFVAFKSDGA